MATAMEAARVFRLINSLGCVLRRASVTHVKHTRCLSSAPTGATPGISGAKDQTSLPKVGNAGARKAEKISQAMKAYLERASKHDKFMQDELTEYEIGKRHLANIMSCDPDNFEQEDIDKAIEYLLPSGIFDKKARPQMKHPNVAIPKRKAAEFGMDGRPFHQFFYTGAPNFYQLMRDAFLKIDKLHTTEDRMLSQDRLPNSERKIILAGSEWIGKEVLEDQMREKLSDLQYKQFTRIMQRLAEHPYSYLEKEFVVSYRKELLTQNNLQEIPPLMEDESGRNYIDAVGQRKMGNATIRMWGSGTGHFTVNGTDLLAVFPNVMHRQQLMFPLQLMDMLGEVDIEATADGGGPSGQAGAIRLAISRALQSFVNAEKVEQLRIAGLLTQDPRKRERKKPGQEGARRKFTWKKR